MMLHNLFLKEAIYLGNNIVLLLCFYPPSGIPSRAEQRTGKSSAEGEIMR